MILGGNGFVAQGYRLYLESIGHEPLVVSRSFCYYPHVAVTRSLLEHYRPHVVINAAGYTGLTVDCCEKHQSDCVAANVTLPVNAARECHKLSIPFVHLSSGCIFDSKEKTFSEEDFPNPISFYTRCKRDAENEIMELNPFVFRLRLPISIRHHPRNLLIKLSKYEKILDGVNSITWLEEFVERSWQIWQTQNPGVWNAVQPGSISIVEVAELLHAAGLRGPVEVWDETEFYQNHVKRSEAVLSSEKFDRAFGSQGTHVLLAVQRCIDKLVKEKERRERYYSPISPHS